MSNKVIMVKFIEDNAGWLVPIIVALITAIIGGLFSLFKKNGGNNQTIKNVKNSNIINIGGDVTINNKD